MSSQEINYSQTTCDKIIDLLKTWDSGNRFKEFFYGDPGEIPTDSQPCVIVDLMDTDVEQGPTDADLVTERINIIIVINKRTYIDDFDDSTVSWKKQLELLVQGNDPVSGQYDPTTILGVLRTNFTMGNYALNQILRVRYGEVPRNGIDEEPTGEAHIQAIVDHHQTSVKI